jgi:hypothetical protein
VPSSPAPAPVSALAPAPVSPAHNVEVHPAALNSDAHAEEPSHAPVSDTESVGATTRAPDTEHGAELTTSAPDTTSTSDAPESHKEEGSSGIISKFKEMLK